jgi:hypothetical protein
LSWLALKLLLFKSTDQLNGREEPDALPMMLDRLEADRGSEMRLARAGRDSDMAPGFWRAKRRSTTSFIRWPAG